MLVLSRRQGEKIRIDEKTVVVVVGFAKGCVRLGFEAPKEIRIVRDELKPKEESP